LSFLVHLLTSLGIPQPAFPRPSFISLAAACKSIRATRPTTTTF
jgi:hypothetical protein